MALEPGGDVDEKRETRGVGFGEAVLAETLDLLKAALGKVERVAVPDHAVDEFVAERMDLPAAPERRHGAAELVRLGAGEARRHHGDLHRLLLEERHAERLLEHAPER